MRVLLGIIPTIDQDGQCLQSQAGKSTDQELLMPSVCLRSGEWTLNNSLRVTEVLTPKFRFHPA